MGVWPITMFAIFVISQVIDWLVLLLIPGRKGFLKSSRVVSWPLTAEQALTVIFRRLQEERFSDVRQLDSPLHVLAKRPTTQTDARGVTIFTHAAKPIEADVQIVPRRGGTEVALNLKMTDFVLLDSGEGEHLEQVIYRLAEGTDRPPVIVANPSPLAMSAVCWALTALAAASLAIYLPVVKQHAAEFAAGIAMSAVASATMAILGLQSIRARPKEISGGWLVVLALLSACAAIGAAGAIFFQLGPFARAPGLT